MGLRRIFLQYLNLEYKVSAELERSVLHSFFQGPVAQRLEQWTHNPLVVGSNPTGPS